MSRILEVMANMIAHNRPYLILIMWTFIPSWSLMCQMSTITSFCCWFVASNSIIMSLVQTGSGTREGEGAVGVNILVLIIALIFIVHSVGGNYVIMGQVLVMNIIGCAGANTLMHSGEGVRQS